MRFTMLMAMVALGARSGLAEIRDARIVTVCMDPGTSLAVSSAQPTASRIFSEIGIELQWYSTRQCPARDAILVTLSEHAPADRQMGTLAYALPYEGTHIVVFYDRVLARAEPGTGFRLLAYVLVHEITHLLEGTDVHSDTGIMKAQWDSQDHFDMRRNRLGFTKTDVDRIYAGLDARQARLGPDNSGKFGGANPTRLLASR
jgi:hypothetical protein